MIATANCLRFLTYLLSCVETDVIECAGRRFGPPKNFGLAPSMQEGALTSFTLYDQYRIFATNAN